MEGARPGNWPRSLFNPDGARLIEPEDVAGLERGFGLGILQFFAVELDAALTTELRSLGSHFEGIAAPVMERAPAFGMVGPISA